MKHADADAILRNRLFAQEFEEAMEAYLSNFEGSDKDDDRTRFEAQIARRTLRTFKERFEYHCREHSE